MTDIEFIKEGVQRGVQRVVDKYTELHIQRAIREFEQQLRQEAKTWPDSVSVTVSELLADREVKVTITIGPKP